MDHDLPLADELAAVSARMSGLLLSRETVHTALSVVTSLAEEALPGAAAAGVTLLDEHGRRTTAAATDPLVEHLDDLQYELGEGPCLSAWEQRRVFRVDDIASEKRWQRWISAARESVMRAALSAPLVAGGDALGAIKVYGHEPGTFGDRDEYLLTMFAAQAAILMANVRSFDNARKLSDALVDQLRGRDVISMAKGILMAREHVDEGTAFAMLARASRDENKKVRDLAGTLIRSTVRRDR
ncbi:GAF domain-containing protein [Lentzea atacamensis]|uniref:GAF domain-containing protein n=1 Tax=Lentzea atacamensis TaxID=531938 RepID=A0ABX9E5W4_9PSEU|nr:GAF and ANTAR domain-containing protein [Lentzea atacamensis]RAS64760.1 GAF domain-containing protein [Lentzea atacamensis]